MAAVPVRLVCGACGAAVGPGDSVCPSCGAALDFSGSTRVPCPSCGHRNVPGRNTCESCGARLVARGASGGGEPRPERRKKKGGEGTRRGEPWMYVAGASVLALVAYVVWLVVQSPSSSSVGGVVGSPMPPSGAAVQAPGDDQIAALEQAVRDRPGDQQALLALANALHDHREWERAIGAYQAYLQKNPANPDARVDMGICYFELSRAKPDSSEANFSKAVSEMEAALRTSPRHVPAAYNLGIIYLQRGDLTKSNEWFRRAIAMDKNHPLAQRAQRMLEQHSFTN